MTNDEEENAVRQLGDLIGYGRMMQLAEQLWRKMLKKEWGIEGGEHTVGPCAAMMVPCPHPKEAEDANGHCDLCCGAGRVTKLALRSFENSFRS